MRLSSQPWLAEELELIHVIPQPGHGSEQAMIEGDQEITPMGYTGNGTFHIDGG